MKLIYRKKEPLPEPKVEPKKEVVLAPKEVTKRLLRGSLCESCLHRLITNGGRHCSVIAKEPTFKEQCTCPNYEHTDIKSSPGMSGVTMTMSASPRNIQQQLQNAYGTSPYTTNGSFAMTSSAFNWSGLPTSPIIPSVPKKSVMHNMNELEEKVKAY